MHLYINENNKCINCFYSESIAGIFKALDQIEMINKKVTANLYCYEEKFHEINSMPSNRLSPAPLRAPMIDFGSAYRPKNMVRMRR